MVTKQFVPDRERTREDKKRDRNEDEEDVYERRRLERRLRDKEAAYQEVRASLPPVALKFPFYVAHHFSHQKSLCCQCMFPLQHSAESLPFVMSRGEKEPLIAG